VSSTEVLGTYLNDHLGGANAGVEMARQLHKRAAAGPDAAVLALLVDDIEQDRDELRALAERLAEAGHPVKKAVGWIAGKAHQFAVDERLTGDEHLSMLLATETLALGIEGKAALWQALLAVAPATRADRPRPPCRPGSRPARPDRNSPPPRRPPSFRDPALTTPGSGRPLGRSFRQHLDSISSS
jgi:hypothetical protein